MIIKKPNFFTTCVFWKKYKNIFSTAWQVKFHNIYFPMIGTLKTHIHTLLEVVDVWRPSFKRSAAADDRTKSSSTGGENYNTSVKLINGSWSKISTSERLEYVEVQLENVFKDKIFIPAAPFILVLHSSPIPYYSWNLFEFMRWGL